MWSTLTISSLYQYSVATVSEQGQPRKTSPQQLDQNFLRRQEMQLENQNGIKILCVDQCLS